MGAVLFPTLKRLAPQEIELLIVIRTNWRISNPADALLSLRKVWMTFAANLNSTISRLNPQLIQSRHGALYVE